MPELIVFHSYNCFHFFTCITELTDPTAVGLKNEFDSRRAKKRHSPHLRQVSRTSPPPTCDLIRFNKAANAQGLQTCAKQVFKHLQVFRPFAFRFALSFPRNCCTRKFKSAGVSLPNWPFIRHFCSTDVHGATPIFLSCPLLFALSVFRSSLF